MGKANTILHKYDALVDTDKEDISGKIAKLLNAKEKSFSLDCECAPEFEKGLNGAKKFRYRFHHRILKFKEIVDVKRQYSL